MKRIISVFLLVLLGLNSIGLFPILKLLQLHAKILAENYVEKQNAAALVVFAGLEDDKNITWEEKGKEFSYRGEMYDIAKEDMEDGNHLYFCYNDKKESEISKQIDLLVNKKLAGEHSLSQNLVLHLMIMLAQVFIPMEPYSFNAGLVENTSKRLEGFFSAAYPLCVLDIPIPPPWG